MHATITELTISPDFQRWAISWMDSVGAELVFDRMYDDKSGIWCELSVFIEAGEQKFQLIPPSRVNLLNSTRTGWKVHADTLEARYDAVEWGEAFRDVIGKVITLFREGEQAQILVPSLVTRAEETYRPFIIEPLVASSGVTVLYSNGGLGKSLLALGACLSVTTGWPVFGKIPEAQGPALYFDYEDDAELHDRRLAGLMEGIGLTTLKYPIIHKRLVAKVTSAQTDMRKLVAETGAVFAVLDSVGMGRGGDAIAGEDTIRMFRSLRSLSIPVLALDHVSSEDSKKDDVAVKPYGTIYTRNSARLLWGGIKMPSSTETVVRARFVNTKGNHVKQQPDMAVEITWTPSPEDEQVFSSIGISVLDEVWQEFELTNWEKIVRVLAVEDRWLTTQDLVTATGVSRESVLTELRRHEDELEVRAGGGRGNQKMVRLKGSLNTKQGELSS